MNSRAGLFEFETKFIYSAAVWPEASCLTSLCPHLIIAPII